MKTHHRGMIDQPNKEIPDWLAELRDPILGDLKLSSFVRAPEHIPDVLKAFGEQSSADRRRIVGALDLMAKTHALAREYEPTLSLTETRGRLNRIVKAGKSIQKDM